jgi:flagellar protein FlaG
MADQITPLGSLASGLPPALAAAAAPAPAPAKVPASQRPAAPPAPAAAKTPEAAMGQLNSHLQQADSSLKFQVDQSTGRAYFQIVNDSTGEVVLQVPSAQMLAMARNLQTLDKKMGVLVDQQG